MYSFNAIQDLSRLFDGSTSKVANTNSCLVFRRKIHQNTKIFNSHYFL